MSVDISGRWRGQFTGSDRGSFVLETRLSESGLSGELKLHDPEHGAISFDVAGVATNDGASLVFTPRDSNSGTTMSAGTATVTVQDNGQLAGAWKTESGTLGEFTAIRDAPQPEEHPRAGQSREELTAISWERQARIESCVVDGDTLSRLFIDLRTGADEAARLELARGRGAAADPGVSFNEMRVLYNVTIMARGEAGEQVVTLDSNILTAGRLPKPLKSISLDIGPYYRLMRNADPVNRASVSLDFTKPPVLDWSNPSGTPTPNSSAITVFGTDSMWVAGVFDKVSGTLRQGRVSTGWLHSGSVYDILLFLGGMPTGLLLSAAVADRLPLQFTSPYRIALFLLVLYASLITFRVGFSFVRWLLPYVEFSRLQQPLHRQIRLLVATLTLGVLGSLAAAVIWKALGG